jgi:site-specific DNA-methyltransferase (adenine-specific)
LGDVTDTLLFFSKTDKYLFNPPRQAHDEEYISKFYRFTDSDGRRYRLHLVERNPALGIRPNLIYEYKGYTPVYGWMMEKPKLEELDKQGKLVWSGNGRPNRKIYIDEVSQPPISNLWDDILPVQAQAAEKLGYPTQKPLTLLERIICASTNPGDVVLDSFCGCGTALAAAQKLGRRWIGIDITHLAIAVNKYRMEKMFPGLKFQVIGEPTDLAGAYQLASEDRYQFQWWALSLIRARPLGGEAGSKQGKKGSDRGVDGVITFLDEVSGKPKRVLIQVKSGHVKSGDIRDLRGTLDREQAAIGVFITLEKPTSEMKKEALEAGVYCSPGWNREYPRLQILTIEELLAGAEVKMPLAEWGTFKQAKRVKGGAIQGELAL